MIKDDGKKFELNTEFNIKDKIIKNIKNNLNTKDKNSLKNLINQDLFIKSKSNNVNDILNFEENNEYLIIFNLDTGLNLL